MHAAGGQVVGPDVEFVLSRAQAIQQEHAARIMTVDHLNDALSALPGGAGHSAGPGHQAAAMQIHSPRQT